MKYIYLLVIFTTPLFAYLDPGTGSMLLSTIVAIFATVIYSIKSFIFKYISIIGSIFGKKIIQKDKYGLVFYSEGEQYASTFYPVLKELKKMNIDFDYLYSDKNDTMKDKIKDLKSHYIGKGNKAFLYLNSLEAKICVTTTPGLNVLQIKKSKGVEHYCHIHHATGGCVGYKKVFNVDYFDSVLVPCQADKEFLQRLEDIRNISKKKIEIIGTPYLDMLSQQINDFEKSDNSNKTILLSPTWGTNGLLHKFGETIIQNILKIQNINLIIRPHPQTIRYEKDLLSGLQNIFKDNSNIIWDYDENGLKSLSKADLMISDFSGIILDFIFLFSKPVITIPSSQKLDGRDYIDKSELLWNTKLYYDITAVLEIERIHLLSNIIKDNINKIAIDDIELLIQEYNPYFKASGKRAADMIKNIYEDIK